MDVKENGWRGAKKVLNGILEEWASSILWVRIKPSIFFLSIHSLLLFPDNCSEYFVTQKAGFNILKFFYFVRSKSQLILYPKTPLSLKYQYKTSIHSFSFTQKKPQTKNQQNKVGWLYYFFTKSFDK